MKTSALITVHTPGAGPNAPFFTLNVAESDTSQLECVPGVGTCLNKALPREYEITIWERDRAGYCGHAASFPMDRWDDALKQLHELAGLNPENILKHAPTQTL